jgi:hypothetical protein
MKEPYAGWRWRSWTLFNFGRVEPSVHLPGVR